MYEIVNVGSPPPPGALVAVASGVDLAVAVIVSNVMRHGCGGSVVVGCGYGDWKAVTFPYTVTSCVTVDALGAKLKEVVIEQYDTHMLPIKSCVVLGWHPVSVVDVELEMAREDVVESILELVEVVAERVVEAVVEFLAEVVENDEIVDDELVGDEVFDEVMDEDR